ncbi:hypothetical protein A2685_01975 [Candidatus Woesebacteria bacterium RIFCSPHIGHO2_01_FULL_37_10]|uniref:Undecaprenyl-phosphate alpha-N-acetylglucosaminyl 1-phosphate transferase n=1 Tax=Candidatus Woesebacteria bacterium RIFCSPHIGHO2_01_FULL_37_10 TaxID=1802489 RepID=A0A1F7XYN8_9BACT|nr:MAG: hypothetical protein A2685_01975 [Candidatus Woesebacteria bacterium RIFCSPHIGHO2_01_FULL_37_10]
MTIISKLVLLPFIFSFLVAFLTTPLVIKLSNKFGLIDDPKKNKHPKVIHTYPIPRGGGIACFFGLLVSALLFLPLDKHLIGILLGAIILVAIGVLDDKHNLNPYKRLAFQFLAAGIPIIVGIGIPFVKLPFVADLMSKTPSLNEILIIDSSRDILELSHPQITFQLFGDEKSIWILADIFALFWIVFMMNMLNMGAKGVDGQLSGVVFIAAATIAILAMRYSHDVAQWPVIVLAVATSAAYLGFLPWHFYPQKIMPGFSGSSLAGYMLAVLAILSTAKVGTLLVALGVPIIDTGYTVIRRVASGKSPVWGDRGHLHHKLLDAGLSKRQISYFYWATTALLGIIALNLNASNKLYTIIGIAIIIGALLLWLTYRPKLLK